MTYLMSAPFTFFQFVTISYEGFEGPFLLSAILRRSLREKKQFEFLLVLPQTDRYSGFYEMGFDNQYFVFANFSSPENDLLEVSGKYAGSKTCTLVKIILSKEWNIMNNVKIFY